MSLKVKRRKRRGQNKKTEQKSKSRGMVRSVCRRAATRHMRWLLGKRKDKTGQGSKKESSCRIPEAARALTFLVDC